MYVIQTVWARPATVSGGPLYSSPNVDSVLNTRATERTAAHGVMTSRGLRHVWGCYEVEGGRGRGTVNTWQIALQSIVCQAHGAGKSWHSTRLRRGLWCRDD